MDKTQIEMTVGIVGAYVSNNPLPTAQLPDLIAQVFTSLGAITSGGSETSPVETALAPAVPIKKSVTPDFIICLDDGRKFKSLKRHLRHLGMTPEQYREKWGLAPDYPMTARNYTEQRSALAKNLGLGRKPGVKIPARAKA